MSTGAVLLTMRTVSGLSTPMMKPSDTAQGEARGIKGEKRRERRGKEKVLGRKGVDAQEGGGARGRRGERGKMAVGEGCGAGERWGKGEG